MLRGACLALARAGCSEDQDQDQGWVEGSLVPPEQKPPECDAYAACVRIVK
jgi:hypothetical protein